MIKIKTEEREILRSTLYQIAIELKENNPEASTPEIRDLLKSMIDVSI